MRIRFNKNALNNLKDSQYCYFNDSIKNNIKFNNHNPIYLEIGCGKGDFILNNALNNPKINYIGLEKNSTILNKALIKIQKNNLQNVKFINCDAKDLLNVLGTNCIDKIYLNFSDPWPKKRHIKRRLTNPVFLDLYKQILKPNSMIEFKTDNDMLYNYTLNEVLLEHKDKYKVIYYTNDLYSNLNNKYNVNNIASEYEKKFCLINKNINKIIFSFII